MNPKVLRAGGAFICFLILFLIIDDKRHDLTPLPPPPPPDSSTSPASSSSSTSTSSSHTSKSSSSSKSSPSSVSPYWQLFAPGTFGNLSASCHVVREKSCQVSEKCGVYAFDPTNVSTLYQQCPNLREAVAGVDPTCCRGVGMLQETLPTDSTIDDLFNLLFNKAHAGKPSAQPAVTFMGDSTWQSFFHQIHRYVCIKPGSDRFECRSPAPEAPMFTHKWHDIPPECKLKQAKAVPKNWWAAPLNEKLSPASFSVVDLRNNRSLYVQFFPFQSIWDYSETPHAHADLGRLKCARGVLERFDQFSDGILFNIGLHYPETDKERYARSLDLILDVFTTMLNKRRGRLQFAIPFESLPTHFVVPPALVSTHTWGECMRDATSLPPSASELAQLSSVPLPAGLFSFACASTQTAADNWRNEILHKECRKKGYKVGRLHGQFVDRCDLHIGTNGDCLHYDFRRHPEFLHNVTVHAFQTALLNDGVANFHFH